MKTYSNSMFKVPLEAKPVERSDNQPKASSIIIVIISAVVFITAIYFMITL